MLLIDKVKQNKRGIIFAVLTLVAILIIVLIAILFSIKNSQDYRISLESRQANLSNSPVSDGLLSPDNENEHNPVSYVASYPTSDIYENVIYNVVGFSFNSTSYNISDTVDPGQSFKLDSGIEVNMMGAECTFSHRNGVTGGDVVESNKFIVNKLHTDTTEVIAPGKYIFTLICRYNGKIYIADKPLSITETNPSICDNVNMDLAPSSAISLDQLKQKIIGKWHGCMAHPWGSGPIEVEFSFNSDGTYSARNYELVVHPNTTRSYDALYWGSAKESALKTFELSDAPGKGIIKILGSTDFITAASIKGLHISNDGNRLYFEVYDDLSGPIKYLLNRV